MSERWQIAACSWSLQVQSIPELERLLAEIGLQHTHLALGDPHHASWEEDDATFIDRVAAAPFTATAAMLGFPGEDYTSPATIQKTGGFGDPSTRQERLELVKWGAAKAKALGLSIMTVHAGFIPEQGSVERIAFLDCLKQALDDSAEQDVVLAFETGQETASLLRATLDELNHPMAKVNFDPANMLLYNKGNPIEAVRILGPDIVHVHAKDARVPEQEGQWGAEVPLDEGQVSMANFLDVLEEVGYSGPLAIEREVGDQAGRVRDVRAGADVLKRLIAAR
jgi:L-ribulose-5-phosphate 3-epimerase